MLKRALVLLLGCGVLVLLWLAVHDRSQVGELPQPERERTAEEPATDGPLLAPEMEKARDPLLRTGESRISIADQDSVTIEGCVLDLMGSPVAGAKIEAWSRGSDKESVEPLETTSESDGGFRIAELPAGDVLLTASANAFDSTEKHLGMLDVGSILSDVEIVLGRSKRTISGRVCFPDGAPARARVRVLPQNPGARPSSSRVTVQNTDEQGGFETQMLAEGLYTLEAFGFRKTSNPAVEEEDLLWQELEAAGFRREEPALLDTPDAGALTTSEEQLIAGISLTEVLALPQPRMGTASLRDVRSGTHGVVLVLEVGLSVRGTLRDDVGAPVDDFLLVARPGEFEPDDALVDYVSGYASEGIAQSFHGCGGRFEFQGFSEGLWTVLAWSNGHGLSPPREISLPFDGELELVVARGGLIEGTVVDAKGNGVPAEVFLQEVPAIGAFDSADWPEEGFATAADGRFALTAIHGTAHVYAESEFGAPSQIVILPIEPGIAHSGVRLELEIGGRIEVEVLDAEGRPAEGYQIEVTKSALLRSDRLATDAQGQAIFENLSAGSYWVGLNPSDDAMRWAPRARVHLTPAGTEHVIFQPPHVQPVRLSGRVTLSSEPLELASLFFWNDDFSESARTDVDGRYFVSVPFPGVHQVLVQQPSWGLTTRMRVEVPAHESFVFDIPLDFGTISGRVRDSEGKPIAGALVQAQLDGDDPWPRNDDVETDSSGVYEIRLPAGVYKVVAAERDWITDGVDASDSSLATSCKRGIVVRPNEAVKEIDFDLVAGGMVEGFVRLTDGALALYALVFVDTVAAPMAGPCQSGRFSIPGIPPGRASVYAVSEGLISAEEISVNVEAGETRSIELVLEHATLVEVRSIDARGEPIETFVEILPRAGSRRITWLSEERYGKTALLPDGPYTARAFWRNRAVEAPFEIAGEEQKLIELRFE